MIPSLYRLVTLQDAKDQSRYLHSSDDRFIDKTIIRASQSIMDYIGDSLALDGWTDTDGKPLVDSDGNPLRIGATGTLDTNGDFVLTLDTNGDPINEGVSTIPGPVEQATVVTVAAWLDDAEGSVVGGLPPAAIALLARFRDPPIA